MQDLAPFLPPFHLLWSLPALPGNISRRWFAKSWAGVTEGTGDPAPFANQMGEILLSKVLSWGKGHEGGHLGAGGQDAGPCPLFSPVARDIAKQSPALV